MPATWTAPRTWVAEEVVDQDHLNEQVRDNLLYLKATITVSDDTELTISGGVVTKTQSYHSIDTEGDAASDDLDTINGGTVGDIIAIHANHTDRTVIVKNGTGNIILEGDSSLDDADKHLMLLYDGANWQVLARMLTVPTHKDTHDPEDGGDPLDAAAAAEIAGVQAAGEGSSHSLARADHVHAINHGIANNHILTVDQADAASGEYAKFTADGLESKSKAEQLGDLNVADGADVTGSNAPQAHKDSHDPSDGGDKLDCAAAGEIVGVAAAAEGSAHSFARSDHTHQVQHGIADNHIVTVDDADAASGQYVRLTANGIEGVSDVITITFIIDGAGVEITTGVKGFLEIPFACGITQVTTLGDQTGSIVVDIWKCSYANFDIATHPVDADSITAAAPPTIAAAVKAQDSTLTGWTKAITAGDILAFNVDSVTDIERVTISLKCTKT